MGKDKKKHSRRDSSSDEEDRQEKKKRKKDEKDRSKANESHEEKMKRRLEKREKKHGKSEENNTHYGYTNEDNPFNDGNLKGKFTWKKKVDHLVATGRADETTDEAQHARAKQLSGEIEKVKKRREDQEKEREEWEAERERLDRERERLEFGDWEQREDLFHKKQTMQRAEIRLTQGRGRPIDILIKHLQPIGSSGSELDDNYDPKAPISAENIDIGAMEEPDAIFDHMDVEDLTELRRDLKTQSDVLTDQLQGITGTPEQEDEAKYWEALIVIADDEIVKAKAELAAAEAAAADNQGGGAAAAGKGGGALSGPVGGVVHASVINDMHALLEGKSVGELDELLEQVTGAIRSGTGDADHWSGMKAACVVHRARAVLHAMHEARLETALQLLQSASGADGHADGFGRSVQQQQAGGGGGDGLETADGATAAVVAGAAAVQGEEGEGGEDDSSDEEDGNFSPVLIHGVAGTAVDAVADKAEMERQREAIRDKAQGSRAGAAAADMKDGSMPKAVPDGMAPPPMEDGDADFNGEVQLDNEVYWWHDKYRPRKPRFFNRVHTGYDWNRYNQAHYDHDNPPPKTVQGYKFNIFYPDLINKNSTPSYKMMPAETPDVCLIKFSAGAPYEDIAFKVVNKEWEYSHRRGFKCSFDRGVLHLYFNFKRMRYRR